MTDDRPREGDTRSPDGAFEQAVQAAVRRQVLLFREFSLSATMTRPAVITEDGLTLYGTITLEELGLVALGLEKVAVKCFVDREEAENQGFIPKLSGERRARWNARMDEEAARLEEELEQGAIGRALAVEPEYVRADYLHHERSGTTLLLYGIITCGGLHGCRVRFSASPGEVARWTVTVPEEEEA